MPKQVTDILQEELSKYIPNSNKTELMETFQFLVENQKLIDSLEKTQDQLFDSNNQITPENWAFFASTIKKLAPSSEFSRWTKEINKKLYAVKYFTDLHLELPETIEDILKFELKKYFAMLLTEDPKLFMETLFNLPFEFTSLVVRYMTNILCPEYKNSLSPTIEEAEEFLGDVKNVRDRFIETINKISLGESNILPIEEAELLLDTKVFFQYNAVNVGVLEYLMRLFNSKFAKQDLYDQFGEGKILTLREQALHHPCYIQYLKKIKKGETVPFFTAEGLQNEDRDKTFDVFVNALFNPEDVLPEQEPEEDLGTGTQQPVPGPVEAETKPDTTELKPSKPEEEKPEEK